MKQINDYIDGYGLIRNGDTGDSCRETGTYATLTGDMLNLAACYTPGGFVRHPFPTDDWHKDPKEFSRDQWLGLMCAVVSNYHNPIAKDLAEKAWSLQRFMRGQNKDIYTYEYVMYARAFRKWYLYPIINLLDLGVLINVIIRIIKSYIDIDDTADDINVSGMIFAFKKNYPTLVIYLASKLHKLRKNGVLDAWTRYYLRPEAPPLDVYAKPYIERL